MSDLRETADPLAGLMELPGDAPTWIWAFTCPTPGCPCRTALVLSTAGDRETLIARGRPVANAWRGRVDYATPAAALTDVTTFAIDLDTRAVYLAVGDGVLDLDAQPAMRGIVERLDDDVLDAIARVWHVGKGLPPPPEKGQGSAKIEIEEWRPGAPVIWDEAHVALRRDLYVLGEHVFETIELYCVEPDCACGEVLIDFAVVSPRGAPEPGCVRLEGSEAPALEPEHERHRERLEQLWAALCRRYPRYRERFARRSAVMHGLAGRFVAAPRRRAAARNGACPCGSGRKYKKCCGAN